MPDVFTIFRADISEFSAKLGQARAEMDSVAKGGGDSMAQFTAFSQRALKDTAAAVVAVGIAAIKLAGDFQQSMERLVTQAGVPQSALKGLSDGVLHLAGQVGFGPNSLADALFHIESSFASTGISGKQAMDILKISAEGAQIGGANLVDVTNALDAAIASGIPGVQNFSQAMGALNAIVGAGDMKMQDLADAMGTGMLAVVKNYGLSLTDVGAALATFGDNNLRGSDAATALRMSVQAMAVPARAGVAVLNEMGMTADQMAKDMQSGGLLKALEDLRNHMEEAGITGNKVGMALTEIFGKRAGTGVAILYDQLSRLQSKYDDINKGANQFQSDWDKASHTFNQQVKDMVAAGQSLLVKLGTDLLPVLSNVIGVLKDLGLAVEHNRTAQLALATIAAATLGPALVQLAVRAGEFASGLYASLGPVGLVVAAVGALSLGMEQASQHIKNAGDAFANSFLETAKQAPDPVRIIRDEIAKLTAEQDKFSAASFLSHYAVLNHINDLTSSGQQYERNQAALKLLRQALDDMTASTKGHAAAAAAAKTATDDHARALKAAVDPAKELENAQKAVAASAKAASAAEKELKAALDELMGGEIGVEKATIDWKQKNDDLIASFKGQTLTLDDNTQAGRNQMKMVLDSLEATQKLAEAVTKETGSTEKGSEAFWKHIAALEGVWRQGGLTEQKIQDLIGQFVISKDATGDLNTALGLNSQRLYDVEHAAGKTDTQIFDLIQKMGLNKDAAGNLSQALDVNRQRMYEVMQQAGLTTASIQGLIDHYHLVPGNVTTQITVDDTAAISQVNQLRSYLASLGLGDKPGGVLVGAGPLLPGEIRLTPGRQSGGPVSVGQPYVVGEAGPELFVPGISGTILPQVGTIPTMLTQIQGAQIGIMGQSWAAGIMKALGQAAGNIQQQLQGIFSGALTPPASFAGAFGMLGGSSVEAIMQAMAAARGWTGPQWVALYNVEMREAGFNLAAQNPTSGAYGIAQFINGPGEYAQWGGDLSPAGQVTAMLNYIAARYGSPMAAWAHEASMGWYDQGGWLSPGVTMAVNNTGLPEMVIPPGGAGSTIVNVTVNGSVVGTGGINELAGTIREHLLRTTRRTGNLGLI